MPDVHSDHEVDVAPVRGMDAGVVGGPVLVLRPRLFLRFAAPLFFALGVLGVAARIVPAALLILVGLALGLTWIPRVEADATALRIRGLRAKVAIPLASIDQIRLRRVPFGRPRPSRRSYRFGRFCTTPIRFRVQRNDVTLTQITVVYWDNWPTLVRYIMSIPEVGSDSRTRGRLDRYGG